MTTEHAPRPWRWWWLFGLALGLSAWAMGFARAQDAAKTTLWWFTLGSVVMAWAQQRSGASARRMWLLLCGWFALDMAVQGVLRGFFGANPQPSVLAEALANTSPAESWDFVRAHQSALALAVGYWAIALALAWRLRTAWHGPDGRDKPIGHRMPFGRVWRRGAWVVLAVLALLLHANPSMLGHQPFARWGVVAWRHHQASADIAALGQARQSLWTQRDQWAVQPPDAAPRTVVLFIGESDNRLNWDLYGYPRSTNSALRQAWSQLGGETLLYRQAWSTQAFTLPSLRLALTPATETHPEAWRDSPDILMLAQAAGYRVRWLSNQPGHDGWLAALARGAEHHTFINHGNWRDSSSTDADLLAPLQAQLREAPSAHELIVVHVLGQHFHYKLRCPGQKGPFDGIDHDAVMQSMQAAGRNASTRRARNAYDNAVHCGGQAVAQMLQAVAQARADRQVMALYFSDHGQEVGHHRDFAGHSSQDHSGYTIPMWLWSNRPWGPVARAQQTQPVALDTLDQTLHTLLGIRSRWYDPRGDWLSQAYAPPASPPAR